MTQKDDDGQECAKSDNGRHTASFYPPTNGACAYCGKRADEKMFVADHRDAQQLREQLEQERHYKRNANQQAANLAVEKVALEERVRVLEEALRDINETVQGHFNGDDLLILRRWLPALLPSPVLPGSTEGGEGA